MSFERGSEELSKRVVRAEAYAGFRLYYRRRKPFFDEVRLVKKRAAMRKSCSAKRRGSFFRGSAAAEIGLE